MKAGIVGASGYTGAELLRLLAAHPAFEVAVATAHSHAGESVGAPHALPGRGLSRAALRGERPGAPRRSRPRLLRAAARRVAADRPRPAGAGRPDRRPRRRLPPSGCVAVPALVRRGARCAGAADRGRVRVARAVPGGSGRGHPRRRGRLLPDGHRAGAGPSRAARPGRAERDHRRRSVGRLGRWARPQGVAALRDGRRGLRRLRAADPPPHARDGADPRRRGAVHPASRPDGPRHPGHLLRPPRGRPGAVVGHA